MTLFKTVLMIASFVLVTACTGDGRIAPGNTKSVVNVAGLPSMRAASVNVLVPPSLVVSEANSYAPAADIVWRGDPFGDRHAQVKAIFEEGIGRGAAMLDGDIPVRIDIQVARFHALTDKTRYSFGGTHGITFFLTIYNAQTQEVMVPAHQIKANLKALGGRNAVAAESIGQTQKARIIEHLSRVIFEKLNNDY